MRSPRHSAPRDSDSAYISVSFSQHVASTLKVISGSKMAAGAPAIKPAFQAMGRKKEQKGFTSQWRQLSFRRLLGSATQRFHSHRPGLSPTGVLSHKGARNCSLVGCMTGTLLLRDGERMGTQAGHQMSLTQRVPPESFKWHHTTDPEVNFIPAPGEGEGRDLILNLERTEYSHLRVTAPCGREAAAAGESVTPRTGCELPRASPNHTLDPGLGVWTRARHMDPAGHRGLDWRGMRPPDTG